MSASASRPRRPVGRVLAEFTVIVVGVLVALVLESWWSDREERRFEVELREDMVAEFEENLEILETDLETNAGAAAILNRFGDLSEADLLTLPDSAFGTWSNQPTGDFGWAGFDPMMGSVEALVRSGNLGAISDRELRLRLSRWSGLLDEKTRYTTQAVTFQSEVLLPTAAAYGADRRWTAAERREILALIRILRARHQNVVRNQVDLRDAAAAILEYLEP